jgi:hypothetical protein
MGGMEGSFGQVLSIFKSTYLLSEAYSSAVDRMSQRCLRTTLGCTFETMLPSAMMQLNVPVSANAMRYAEVLRVCGSQNEKKR